MAGKHEAQVQEPTEEQKIEQRLAELDGLRRTRAITMQQEQEYQRLLNQRRKLALEREVNAGSLALARLTDALHSTKARKAALIAQARLGSMDEEELVRLGMEGARDYLVPIYAQIQAEAELEAELGKRVAAKSSAQRALANQLKTTIAGAIDRPYIAV